MDLTARRKIVAVMPAYNAEATIAKTVADLPPGAVDGVLLVGLGSLLTWGYCVRTAWRLART